MGMKPAKLGLTSNQQVLKRILDMDLIQDIYIA